MEPAFLVGFPANENFREKMRNFAKIYIRILQTFLRNSENHLEICERKKWQYRAKFPIDLLQKKATCSRKKCEISRKQTKNFAFFSKFPHLVFCETDKPEIFTV